MLVSTLFHRSIASQYDLVIFYDLTQRRLRQFYQKKPLEFQYSR